MCMYKMDPLLILKCNGYTVKPVTSGHLKKCPYMTGVPSSQLHFNVKVYFGSQKMRFRHPNLDILVSPRHRFYCIGTLIEVSLIA